MHAAGVSRKHRRSAAAVAAAVVVAASLVDAVPAQTATVATRCAAANALADVGLKEDAAKAYAAILLTDPQAACAIKGAKGLSAQSGWDSAVARAEKFAKDIGIWLTALALAAALLAVIAVVLVAPLRGPLRSTRPVVWFRRHRLLRVRDRKLKERVPRLRVNTFEAGANVDAGTTASFSLQIQTTLEALQGRSQAGTFKLETVNATEGMTGALKELATTVKELEVVGGIAATVRWVNPRYQFVVDGQLHKHEEHGLAATPAITESGHRLPAATLAGIDSHDALAAAAAGFILFRMQKELGSDTHLTTTSAASYGYLVAGSEQERSASPESAHKLYEKAIRADPDNAAAWLALGMLRGNRHGAAKRDFESAAVCAKKAAQLVELRSASDEETRAHDEHRPQVPSPHVFSITWHQALFTQAIHSAHADKGAEAQELLERLDHDVRHALAAEGDRNLVLQSEAEQKALVEFLRQTVVPAAAAVRADLARPRIETPPLGTRLDHHLQPMPAPPLPEDFTPKNAEGWIRLACCDLQNPPAKVEYNVACVFAGAASDARGATARERELGDQAFLHLERALSLADASTLEQMRKWAPGDPTLNWLRESTRLHRFERIIAKYDPAPPAWPEPPTVGDEAAEVVGHTASLAKALYSEIEHWVSSLENGVRA